MSLLLASLASLGTYLSIEIIRYQRHLKNLEKIKNRIHVNGTRGKSSTTRLIYQGLKANPENIVVAKTTGTVPRFIFPDGKELPVARPGKPNIIEQLRIVKMAAQLNANFFVTECMAITPEYIKVFEENIMKSNVGVITNVREDHLDVMGPTLLDVARNLCLSIPKNGVLFTCEEKFFDIIRKECEKRKTEIFYVDSSWVNEEILKKFSYIEHKNNVAIALHVCEYFGIKREDALNSMYNVNPDPGVLEKYVIEEKNKKVEFYSAFSANDPESTSILWQNFSKDKKTKIVLFVLRSDRAQRTESFLKFLGDKIIGDYYVICGEHSFIVKNNLIKKGVEKEKIITFRNPKPEEIFERVLEISEDSICMGIGNIVGLGNKIREIFKSKRSL
ncbi:MAG: poly-gamma-glutamate synthase PgsB [Candidatus Hydrothermales bacterium]